MPFIAPIVEGHGEVEAVPSLLYRLSRKIAPSQLLIVNPPIRIKSGSFINDTEYFRKYVILASAKAAQSNGLVLILLDCDDTCPGTLGPSLLNRARVIRSDVPCLVVLAYREYESWFLASAPSLRGLRGLSSDLDTPSGFESVRGAKGWLGSRMDVGYDPIIHQLEFTRRFDIDLAVANSASFARFYRKISSIILSQQDPQR